MRTDNSNAVETILNDTKIVLEAVRTQVYQTLNTNDNVGLGDLADKIANDLTVNEGYLNIDSAFVKSVISSYLKHNTEIICVKGKGGGLCYKDVYEKKQSEAAKENEKKTLSKYAKTAKELGYTDKAMFERAKRALGTEKPTIAALKEWMTNNGKEIAA